MTDSNIIQLKSPTSDALGEVLKEGAQQLLGSGGSGVIGQLQWVQVEGK